MVCRVTSEDVHFMGTIKVQSVAHCRVIIASHGVGAVEVHLTEQGVEHSPVRVATR